MEPLIAGASWTDVPARSAAFLVNIGRTGGIAKEKLEELLKSYNKNALIMAAIHAGDRIEASVQTGFPVTCLSRALNLEPLAEAQERAGADQLNCRDSVATICSPFAVRSLPSTTVEWMHLPMRQ
jgi:hypothetical protein